MKIEDDISTPSRAEEHKDSSTEDFLLEFVKVDESEHLETVATEQASKMQAMHTLMKCRVYLFLVFHCKDRHLNENMQLPDSKICIAHAHHNERTSNHVAMPH